MLLMPGATYLGPPDSNWGGSVVRPPMGMVVHIAEGSYQGTIGWQQNPIADVSSFFVVSQLGDIAQMLDLNKAAWTQAAGNPMWIGVENEGFHTDQLTPIQAKANAEIFAFLVQTWPTIPLQVTNSPNVGGIGWHGMGGVPWGNHPDCPGPNNVALLPSILAETILILNPALQPQEGVDMIAMLMQDETGMAVVWYDGPNVWFRGIPDGSDPVRKALAKAGVTTYGDNDYPFDISALTPPRHFSDFASPAQTSLGGSGGDVTAVVGPMSGTISLGPAS